MCLFKKKKMYRVKYRDDLGAVIITVVKAADIAQACRAVEKRHPYRWQVQQVLEINEVEK